MTGSLLSLGFPEKACRPGANPCASRWSRKTVKFSRDQQAGGSNTNRTHGTPQRASESMPQQLVGQAPCSDGNRSRWMHGFQPGLGAPVCLAGSDRQHRQRRLGAAREYYREGRSIRLPASSRPWVRLASRGSRLLTGLGGAQFPCRFGDSRDLPRASMDSLAHEPDPSSQHPEPLGRQQC